MKESKKYDTWEWEDGPETKDTDAGLWRGPDDNRLPSPKIEPKEESNELQD